MKIIFVSFFIVLADQISKLIIKGFSIPFLNINHKGMYQGERIPVIKDYFSITFVENPGIAFGIDFGVNFKLVLSLLTLFATIALIIYLYKIKERSFLFRLSIALILGGAAGNLIDRLFYGVMYNYASLFYGKVVDFIDIKFFHLFVLNKTFGNYILNIADLAVSAGIIMLLFSYKKDQQHDVKSVLPEGYTIEDKGTV